MRRALRISVLIGSVFIITNLSIAQSSWIQTNGPLGGDIRKLVFSKNGNAYALSYAGRIYRSTDVGNTWQELSTDIGGLFTTYVAVDSTGNIYAAASDVYAVTSQASIYKSTNGDKWTYLGTVPTQKQILTLGISASGHLYAGTGGTTIFRADGPFRSTDGGSTWSVLGIGSKPDALLDILFASSGKIFALAGSGLYRSSDNGQSWASIWIGNGSSLALDSSGFLFIGSNIAPDLGVFRSTNEGGTWGQVDSGLSVAGVRCLAIDVKNTIYAGTEGGIFASRDNGSSWRGIATTQITNAVQSVAINSQGYILAGTQVGSQAGGIFRSTDAGSTWYDASNGLTNLGIVSLAADQSGRIYSAGQYRGLWGSSDKGNSWTDLRLTSESIATVAVDQSGRLFAGSSQKVFWSTDAGATWRASIVDDSVAPYVRVIAFGNSGRVFAGTFQGVFRSLDTGKTWQKTNKGLTNLTVRSFAVSTNGDILTGTVQGLFRSTDGGDTWASSGMSGENVGSIVVSPRNYLFAASLYGGVFRSTDNGMAWKTINTGLPRPPTSSDPNIPIEHLAVNLQGKVFVAVGHLGIYCSTNDGETWAPINDGLTDPSVRSLCVDASGYLFAGTAASGVFRTLQSTLTGVLRPSVYPVTFGLCQNYPNPFNPSTTIQYQVPKAVHVSLRILNVLGQVIATLVDELKREGYYQVQWSANVPSGIYFYCLQAGEYVETKKMVLLR